MGDAFDAGRSGYNKRKRAEEEERRAKQEESREVIRRVVEQCRDRMDEEGYDLEVIYDTIFIRYKEDWEAKSYDPNDEDEIDKAPFYDDRTRTFTLFSVHAGPLFRRGWHLNKFSGMYIDEYNEKDINTSIDTSKPWEDELLRIIGEFLEHNRSRALENRHAIQVAEERKRAGAKGRRKEATITLRRTHWQVWETFAIVGKILFSTVVLLYAGQVLMFIGHYLAMIEPDTSDLVEILLFMVSGILGGLLWLVGFVLSIPLFTIEYVTGLCLAIAPGISYDSETAKQTVSMCHYVD